MAAINKFLAGAWACAAACHAAAQSAPAPVVPPATTPSVVPSAGELAPRAKPATLPADALSPSPRAQVARELGKPENELTLDVDAFTVPDDAPAALKAALPALTAPFIGKGKSYEDLVNAAAEVTRFLQRDLGYYLGYAYIPEQNVQGRQVRIGVLEGRLDRVILNWGPGLPVDREVVEAYLDHLHPGDILTVRDVERVVFLINDLRGITVRAEVKTGSKPGTASLEFTPKADGRFNGKVDADANGSRFIGTARVGALLGVNSPTGAGDGLTATTLVSTTGGLRFGLLGYTRPVGSDGLKLGASFSATRYLLDTTIYPLHIQGHGSTVNGFALYPWVRSRNLNLFSLTSVDYKGYTDGVSGIDTIKHVTDLSLGVTGDFRDSVLGGGVNTFELNLVTGRLRYNGGIPSGLDDAPTYTKISFGYSRLQDLLTGRLMGYLAVNGQLGLRNLDTTEQFRAGGPDAVRAFASGEGTGDSGVVVTSELRLLPAESLFGKRARELVFAGFVDAALVQVRHDPGQLPRAADYRNEHGYAGVGLSAVWQSPSGFQARLSLATPVHGTARSDTAKHDPRIYFSSSYVF